MTTGPRTVPIRNFQDIIDNDYTVITRPSTANAEYLRTAREGTPMLQVWNEMKDDESKFHIKISDALSIIDNDPKTLFWAPDTNILGNNRYEWLKLEDAVYTQAGFGVQQNSEFTQLFDYWTGVLDENGMKLEMMRDATYTGLDKFWVEDATELGFEHIALPFLLLAGGIGVALTVSLSEKILGKRKSLSQRMMDTPGKLGVKISMTEHE